jgi:mRNA interferase RelE/StbE
LKNKSKNNWVKFRSQTASRIKFFINQLAKNPRPQGCKKLKGRNGYRIRQGNYRIIYEIKDSILTVFILAAGHRKEIYE